jgi:hypothetical protein
MNCDECIDNYYFINGTKNCYDNETILPTNEYYFSENKFYKCYYKCSKCYNSVPDEENNFCIKCNNDLYLLENTNNCYNISLLSQGYYLDIDFIFKKCYESCETCDDYYINKDMNCLLCKDGYYKINGTNNCFNESTLNEKYFLENDLFYPCYDSCLTCSDSLNINNITLEENHNCLSCLPEYNFKYQTQNCYNETLIEQGYYLSSNDTMYHKCDIQCKTCYNHSASYEQNCLLCNNDENYYKAENKTISNCYNNETINNNYCLDIKNKI